MKLFRILLVVLILALVGIIAFMLFTQQQSDVSSPEEGGYQTETNGSQAITDIPNTQTQSREIEISIFEPTAEGYEIKRGITTGLMTNIAKSNPSTEFNDLLSYFFIDKYWVDECAVDGEIVGRSITITASPDPDLLENQFDPAEQAVLDWEPQIVSDIGKTLYPNISQSQLNAADSYFTIFRQGSRYTTFGEGSNQNELHYGWVLNFAVFSTSHSCLIATINDLYAPNTH